MYQANNFRNVLKLLLSCRNLKQSNICLLVEGNKGEKRYLKAFLFYWPGYCFPKVKENKLFY